MLNSLNFRTEFVLLRRGKSRGVESVSIRLLGTDGEAAEERTWPGTGLDVYPPNEPEPGKPGARACPGQPRCCAVVGSTDQRPVATITSRRNRALPHGRGPLQNAPASNPALNAAHSLGPKHTVFGPPMQRSRASCTASSKGTVLPAANAKLVVNAAYLGHC